MAFSSFLRSVGAPVEQLFGKQGLPTQCEDPDAFVSLSRTWAFFDAAEKKVDPMVGWHVGNYVGDRNLNGAILSKLVRAPTLILALRTLIRKVRAEASHIEIGITERKDDIIFYTTYPGLKGVAGYNASQAYQLGLYRDLVRRFAGRSWVPPEVGIEYPVVPEVAKEFFPGSRILPRQRIGYLTIPRACLHLASPDAVKIRGKEPSIPCSYAEVLSTLLKPYLQEGYPDTRLAASLMDTSVRTLSRRLTSEGTSYRDFIDQLRFNEAKRVLSDPGTKIIDAAASAGFEDAAHFTRMFRRVGGISPIEFKRSLV